jgi:NADH-quinone oxidoreductase subunit F
MLVQAIPAYRLPRDLLAKEVQMIQKMGAKLRLGVRLGEDITLGGLKKQGYQAVFLAVGAPAGVSLGLKKEQEAGVVEAIDFLREYNLTGKAKVGQSVVVVGGGNAAVDAARTALRLGAKRVSVVYRRTRAEMPAYAEEVEEAEKEGVRFEFLAAPLELEVKKGKLAAVRCRRMELGEFDRSGRRKPVSKEGGGFDLPADTLIAAIGQTLKAGELLDGAGLKLNERDFIAVNPASGQTSEPWIFAGGDAVSGPSSVIEAIAAGEKAAVGIDQFLTGEAHASWRSDRLADTAFDPDADPVETGRAPLSLIPVSKRRLNFDEVESTWSRTVALAESKRCLRCDYRGETVAVNHEEAR